MTVESAEQKARRRQKTPPPIERARLDDMTTVAVPRDGVNRCSFRSDSLRSTAAVGGSAETKTFNPTRALETNNQWTAVAMDSSCRRNDLPGEEFRHFVRRLGI